MEWSCPSFARQAVRGEPITVFGSGEQSRCFAHVGDAAEAIVRLLGAEKALGGVFNVGSDREITIHQLAEMVRDAAESESPIVRIPYEEAYAEGFEDMMRRVPSVEKLERTIGFRPTTPIETIVSRGRCGATAVAGRRRHRHPGSPGRLRSGSPGMRGILTYHSIDSSRSAISIDEAAFRRHVRWLVSGRVRVTALDELLAVPAGSDVMRPDLRRRPHQLRVSRLASASRARPAGRALRPDRLRRQDQCLVRFANQGRRHAAGARLGVSGSPGRGGSDSRLAQPQPHRHASVGRGCLGRRAPRLGANDRGRDRVPSRDLRLPLRRGRQARLGGGRASLSSSLARQSSAPALPTRIWRCCRGSTPTTSSARVRSSPGARDGSAPISPRGRSPASAVPCWAVCLASRRPPPASRRGRRQPGARDRGTPWQRRYRTRVRVPARRLFRSSLRLRRPRRSVAPLRRPLERRC